MNDLPRFVNNKSTPILLADNLSILFTDSNTAKLNSNNHTVLESINIWFKNCLSLNFEATHCIHLIGANPLCYINIQVFIPSKTQQI
jgi:hypothetical protein